MEIDVYKRQLLYLFVCKGKIPAYLGSSFAFIAPVAGVLSAGLGYEAAKGAFVVFGLSFVILSILVRYIGTRWIDKLFPPAAMGCLLYTSKRSHYEEFISHTICFIIPLRNSIYVV